MHTPERRWMPRYWSVLLWIPLALSLAGCRSGSDRSLRFQYRYDKQDRLVETTTPGGSSTKYYYDKQNRLVSVRYSGGGSQFGYAEDGLFWTKDSEGSTEYYRDNLGRISDLLWRRGGDKIVHLDLDPWGNLIGVAVYSLPSGSGPLANEVRLLRAPPSADRGLRDKRREALAHFLAACRAAGDSSLEYWVRYDRDVFGRITAMDNRAGRVTFVYRDDLRESERRLPNGIRTVWRHNSNGSLESLVHYDPTGRELASFMDFYDDSGQLAKVVEVVSGRTSEKQFRRDARGIVREVRATSGAPEDWQFDAYGRPIRQGQAALEWNKGDQLAARTVNGRRVQFEYDGRDLPIRAAAGRTRYGFRWDAEARLDAVSTPQGNYALLPDLTGATAEPWMKWKIGEPAATDYFSDGAIYAEIGPRGELRYLLRDGEGNVCLSADPGGRVEGARSARPKASLIRLASFGGPSDTAGDQIDESDYAAQIAEQTAQIIAELREKWDDPQLRGLLFNTKVQNYVKDFLGHSPQSQVDYVFNGIGNDWHDATRENNEYYSDKRGIFIPMFASIPKATDLLACILWEKPASVIPVFGRMMQTRKVDLAQIFDQTTKAGKQISTLTFESGAGFEEQRQADALINYARQHPDWKRPTIIIDSTGDDAGDRKRLTAAHFQVVDYGKDRLVSQVVSSGFLAGIPLGGRVLSVPIEAGQAAWTFASAEAHGKSPFDGHGISQQPGFNDFQSKFRTQPLVELTADRQNLLLKDPSSGVRKELGGIELGAKVSAAPNVGTIRGVIYDKNSGRVALLGDREISAEGLDAGDFAVALLLAYNDPPITPQFSLDPADPKHPDGKWMKAVYRPAELLAGTAMGRTMFLTDWLMKQYSFGMSVDSNGVATQLFSLPGGLLDQFTLDFQKPGGGSNVNSWTRLWIVPDDFRIQVHGSTLVFETARMRVRAKRQVVDPSSPTGLRDDEREVDASAREFAARFTANYDKVAEEVPEFRRLRELAKAVALARWLRDSGVSVDLQWAQQVAYRRSAYADKVPTLRNQREHTVESRVGELTTTLRLTGGVDLAVAPILMANAPLAEEVSEAAAAALLAEPAFMVDAAESKIEGAVLPVTPGGREAWTKAGRQLFGDATRTLDSAGRPVALEYDSGNKVLYSYAKGGSVSAARVVDANGQVDVLNFGPEGKLVSGELRGKIAMTATREADGALDSLRFSLPDGGRVEMQWGKAAGELTPPGGSRLTVVRGGHNVFRYYDARGDLVSLDVDGAHVASFGVDGATAKAWSGSYTESVAVSPDGAARIYTRTAPDLDGKIVTQVARVPIEQADRAMVSSLPEGRVELPSGNTMDVAFERSGSGTTLELREFPVAEDVVVGEGRAVIDAQGRISHGGRVVGQLGTESAPARMTLLNTPAARIAELQGRYGATTEFYSATDLDLANRNLARIPTISRGDQVVTYLPSDRHLVEDFGEFDKRDFTALKVEEGIGAIKADGVVLNGDSSPQLKAWVEEMGRAGALRDRFLVLNTCEGAIDMEWNSKLISEYGLSGTYSYEGKISAQSAKDAVMELDKMLKFPRSSGESIPRLWREAIKKAAEEAPTRALRQEIERLLNGIIQISLIRPAADGPWRKPSPSRGFLEHRVVLWSAAGGEGSLG